MASLAFLSAENILRKNTGFALKFSSPSADKQSMDTSPITALSQALDLGSARLQAIRTNLSNVNTPGFKRQDATFAALLNSAQSDGGSVAQATPDPRDLTLDDDPGQSGPPDVHDPAERLDAARRQQCGY